MWRTFINVRRVIKFIGKDKEEYDKKDEELNRILNQKWIIYMIVYNIW